MVLPALELPDAPSFRSVFTGQSRVCNTNVRFAGWSWLVDLEHFVNRLNRFWIPVWAEV